MTTINAEMRQMLEKVAEALGPELRERLVFVGGCTTALFITDPIVLEDIRVTDDVDLIVDLAGHAAWAKLQQELVERGFSVSSEDEVICRMRLGILKVDFMPDDEEILGFSNRWYARGIDTAIPYSLTEEMTIKHLTSEMFLATKLEAYLGRGGGDLMGSHDIEDILIVLDGREELIDEVRESEDAVRSFIATEFGKIQVNYDFYNLIAGNIRGPEGRAEIVRERITKIAEMDR